MYYQKSGIYLIRNRENQKVYVGSSINVSVRITSHKNLLKRGKHGNHYLQRAWDFHGSENFEFEIVEYCDEAMLINKEEETINKYNSKNKDFGYNLESFERGRRRHSEETKRKIGLGNKGKRTEYPLTQEQKAKQLEAIRKPKSEEHKRKIAEAHKDKKRPPFSQEWRKKMSDARKRREKRKS